MRNPMPDSPHGAGLRAVHHTVHLLRYRRDVPFEGISRIEVEERLELGIGEVDSEVQIDGDERRVLPELKARTETHLEVGIELVTKLLVDGDVEVPVLHGFQLIAIIVQQMDLAQTCGITHRGHVDELAVGGGSALRVTANAEQHGYKDNKRFFHNGYHR